MCWIAFAFSLCGLPGLAWAFDLELVPSGCAAESCGHWISLKEGLDLSCYEGLDGRMGIMAGGIDQCPGPRGGVLAGDIVTATP